MNQKLITVLFVSLFCYGVTYSSPLNPQNEGMGLPEEKPPTDPSPTTEHINKKIETSNITIQHVNTSKILNSSSETPKTVTDPAPTLKKTESHPNVTEEVMKENTSNKSKPISSGKILNESTAATSVPTSNVTPAALPTTASTNTSSTAVPPAPTTNITKPNSTNTSANETSTTTKAPETNSTTTRAPESTSTKTTTTTTTKPTTTSSSPVSTNKDNVVEHNTPAPIQEKHFDGQSFIGGMALTIGLTAIGFVAFKYYKSGKIDMNYRTL